MLVWDHFELRAVGSACAALPDTSYESLRKGRIIAGRADGPDLPLNTAKIFQAIGVGPSVRLSKPGLLSVWQLSTPLRSATTTVCCDATVGGLFYDRSV